MSPFLALFGRASRANQCPVSGVKHPWRRNLETAESDPTRPIGGNRYCDAPRSRLMNVIGCASQYAVRCAPLMNNWSPRAEAPASARVAATPCKITVLLQNICQRQCDPSRLMRLESPTFSCGRLMRCVSDATALPRIDCRRKHARSLNPPSRRGSLPVMVVNVNKTSNVPPGKIRRPT
jgi:hypothetical protein